MLLSYKFQHSSRISYLQTGPKLNSLKLQTVISGISGYPRYLTISGIWKKPGCIVWLRESCNVAVKPLAESCGLWRLHCSWRLCFQDVSLMWLLAGGLSSLLAVGRMCSVHHVDLPIDYCVLRTWQLTSLRPSDPRESKEESAVPFMT